MKTVRFTRLPLIGICFCTMLAACSDDEPDAYGSFEATEVMVAAEAGGHLLRFDPTEGESIAGGALVGMIDTIDLDLQRRELIVQREASTMRIAEAHEQVDVLEAQLSAASKELRRTRELYAAEAATAQQLDMAEGEVGVLNERIDAARTRTGITRGESAGVTARIRQIEERIAKSRITNPISGTVLATYVEQGELVQPGQPLYTIAALDTMTLRAYVSEAQLAAIRIGEEVRVRIDNGPDNLATLPGRVSWIAHEAEFTPTPIQTREERTSLVYAVKIRVPNPEGVLKIGMPGELVLDEGTAATESR